MIQKDYLVRMIQKTISLLVQALLQKRKLGKKEIDEYQDMTEQILGITPEDLVNYNPDEIIKKYSDREENNDMVELAAMTMLMIAEELDNENLLQKSRLEQNGIYLLKYLQENSGMFSLQREEIINKKEI